MTTPAPNKLTVGELRKILEGQPDDAEVLISMDDGCCGDTIELDAHDWDTSLNSYDKKPGYVTVRVNAVPGYRSCIQAGGTKRADEKYWRRNKDYVSLLEAGQKPNLQQHIREFNDASENYRTRMSLPEWLGFTQEEWQSYLDSSMSIQQILDTRKKLDKPEEGLKKELMDIMRQFGLFRMRLRNALGRAGTATNPGWTEADIATAVEKLADKRLEEAPPINTLKLAYLRKESREYRSMSDSLAKEAAEESDHEKWDQSRIMLGQACAFEQMIGYTRSLSHKQLGVAKRKGKL